MTAGVELATALCAEQLVPLPLDPTPLLLPPLPPPQAESNAATLIPISLLLFLITELLFFSLKISLQRSDILSRRQLREVTLPKIENRSNSNTHLMCKTIENVKVLRV
jgi:hypothetical protein